MTSNSQLFSIKRNTQYNSIIALTRFLLAIYVVFFHAIPRYALYGHSETFLWNAEMSLIKLFQNFDETNPAVLAFIVISGYCIHRNGLRLNYMHVGNFFKKRLMRIAPMLMIGTLLGIVIFYYMQNDSKAALITNTQNITFTALMYKLSGIFVFVPYKFEQLIHLGNGPLLTCIMEGWLYICYPIAMLIISKLGDKRFWLILAMLLLCGLRVCAANPELNSWWHNGAIISFMVYWWIGAYAVDLNNKIYNCNKLIMLGYVILSIAVLNVHSLLLIELRKLFFASLVASFLRWSETKANLNIPRNIIAPSFSIYALHMPLLCLGVHFEVNIYVTIALILLCANLTYHYIEKPCMKFAERESPQAGLNSATLS